MEAPRLPGSGNLLDDRIEPHIFAGDEDSSVGNPFHPAAAPAVTLALSRATSRNPGKREYLVLYVAHSLTPQAKNVATHAGTGIGRARCWLRAGGYPG